jgi:hypothetical protein
LFCLFERFRFELWLKQYPCVVWFQLSKFSCFKERDEGLRVEGEGFSCFKEKEEVFNMKKKDGVALEIVTGRRSFCQNFDTLSIMLNRSIHGSEPTQFHFQPVLHPKDWAWACFIHLFRFLAIFLLF